LSNPANWFKQISMDRRVKDDITPENRSKSCLTSTFFDFREQGFLAQLPIIRWVSIVGNTQVANLLSLTKVIKRIS